MAGYQKQVMDIKVGKGFDPRQSDEHKRNWGDRKWERVKGYGAYDRTREHLNFEIVKGRITPVDKSKSIPDAIRENLAERGIKDPNEGLREPKYRTVVNFIFGGSRERMHQLAFGDQHVNLEKDADNSSIRRHSDIEKWALDIYRFVADRYGEENIAAFVVHLDETNPHIHCTLLPIQNGKFAYKKIFAGVNLYDYKDKMRKLHDDLAVVNKRWGLVRGSDVSVTGARNIPPQEYRRLLSIECDDLQRQIHDAKSILFQLQSEVKRAETRVRGLNTMVANLEQKRDELEAEMQRLGAELQAGNGDADALQRRIDALNRQYEDTVLKLSDKRQKLVEANRKLSEYRSIEEESRDKIDEYKQLEKEYRAEAMAAASDQSKQIQLRINDAAMSQILDELKIIAPAISHAKEALGDTLLYDIATNGENILRCAAMLFMGYVDGAVSFAKSCGGGGGSTGGWGKKDYEDENAFRHRCLFTAAKMMRPSGGNKVKRK